MSYDQVGTLRAVSKEDGTIVKRIEYDAFGNVLYVHKVFIKMAQEKDMLNKKKYLIYFIILLSPIFIYGIGFFISEKYCVGKICFNKPPYYRFKLFVGNGEKPKYRNRKISEEGEIQ